MRKSDPAPVIGWVEEPYKSDFFLKNRRIFLSEIGDYRSENDNQSAFTLAKAAGYKYVLTPKIGAHGERLYLTRGNSPRCVYSYILDNDKKKAQQKELYSKSLSYRVSLILANARTRAKKFGIEFNLVEADIFRRVQFGVCEVTGMKLDLNFTGNRRNWLAPSLDQKIPRNGYTMENIQIVSVAYNTMKSDLPDNLFREIASMIALSATRHVSKVEHMVKEHRP